MNKPCSICYEELDSSIWKLKCDHEFHGDCVVMTLMKHNNCCPLCRQDIIGSEAASVVAYARAASDNDHPQNRQRGRTLLTFNSLLRMIETAPTIWRTFMGTGFSRYRYAAIGPASSTNARVLSNDRRCQALTQIGTQCRNARLVSSDFCWQHDPVYQRRRRRCTYMHRNGNRCSSTVGTHSQFCDRHQPDVDLDDEFLNMMTNLNL